MEGRNEILGRIIELFPLQEGISKKTGKAWKRQDFVLETIKEQYPRKIYMQAWNELAEHPILKQGEGLVVEIELASREYEGHYYTNVQVFAFKTMLGI